MSLSPYQLAIRKTGITATDIAAIVRLHPYKRPVDVWMDKTDRALPFVGNDYTKWGNILEAPIRDDYAERHGVRVEIPGTLVHSGCEWAIATPDGICYRPRSAYPCNGLEVKVHNWRVAVDNYGEAGTDEVPMYELIQCVWNMYVTGLDRWDLVAFIDNQPRDYHLYRDDELIGLLVEEAEKFRRDHLETDTPPEPDGSDSYDSYLERLHPAKRRLADYLSIDEKPEAMMQLRALRRALEELETTKTEVEVLKQNLKALCGDHSGLSWTDNDRPKGIDRIHYKNPKDSKVTNWEAAWRGLVTTAQLALSQEGEGSIDACLQALTEIADENRSIELHTAMVPNARRFMCPRHWKKNPTTDEERD
jgi:putative phage-type endonuclease